MFVGKYDLLGDVKDARWAHDQIINKGWGSDILVHYEEFAAGHCSFMVGKDMSYLTNVLKVMDRYNGFA